MSKTRFKSEEDKNRYAKNTVLVAIILIVTAIVVPVVIQVYRSIAIDYRYNVAIGGHLENALDGSTPEIMKENLLKAKEGMIAEGLTPDDYGAYWHWMQTPDYKMDYTYRYIDGLINRTEYVISWRDTNNATATPALKDVYNEMLDNLRTEYNRRGPIDWAAHPAWFIKYYSLWYFQGEFTVVWIIALLLLAVIIVAVRWRRYDNM